MASRLARSQAPGHEPADESLPAWAAPSHDAHDAGDDVITYAGAHVL
jgi:hypothetical protein